MISTRVLLSIEQQLCRQLLQHACDRHPEVEVVGQSSNVIEILALMDQFKPHVFIHSWDDGPDYRAFLSHAHEIVPDLVIVQFDPDNTCGYLQVPVKSIGSLLTYACTFAENVEPAYTSHR